MTDQSEDPAIEYLWAEYTRTRSLEARNKLVENYYPLARIAAYMFLRRSSRRVPDWANVNIIIASAGVGLINAIENFETRRGVAFQTYAHTRMRGAIIDDLRQTDWVPRRLRRAKRNLDQASNKLVNTLGRQPGSEELAIELGLEVGKLVTLKEEVANMWQMTPLDLEEDGESSSHLSILEDPESEIPLEKLLQKEAAEKVLAGLKKLPRVERVILRLYYSEEITMLEIGDFLGISESRISQLHDQALWRLKRYLESRAAK